jgi:hypothetical protein
VLEDTALWWRRVRCGDRLIETVWKAQTVEDILAVVVMRKPLAAATSIVDC